MFQNLRELRDLRRTYDPGASPSSLLDVALELETDTMYVFIPPDHAALAIELDAQPCEAPVFDDHCLKRMSIEHHPDHPPRKTPQADGSVADTHFVRTEDGQMDQVVIQERTAKKR